jgi:hypothetical protein
MDQPPRSGGGFGYCQPDGTGAADVCGCHQQYRLPDLAPVCQPGSASDWEEDLLGASEVLENGRTKRITLTGYKSPRFDVRAVDSDGDSYTRMNVNVRESDVIFRLSDIDI